MFKIKKSLYRRICLMSEISTVLTVFLMSIILLSTIHWGLSYLGNQAANYYADQLNRIVEHSYEMNRVIGEKFQADSASHLNGILLDEIQTMSNGFPFMDVFVVINEQLVKEITGTPLFPNTSWAKDDAKDTFLTNQYKGYLATKSIHNPEEAIVGEVTVGISSAVQVEIYTIAIGCILLIAFLVLGIMRLFTRALSKSILNPLMNLQNDLENIADERYTNVHPTITIGSSTVKEVADLGEATIKIINKMISYSELITQTEKMASVGQLTAAITHEINTPLGVIDSNVQMMKMMALQLQEMIQASDENAQKHAEANEVVTWLVDSANVSEEACTRIQAIIKSLRSFSRIDQADFMPADINESVKGAVTLTTNLHKNRIHVHENYGNIPPVQCFIGLINQVFMNLIINAIQAIDGDGEIYVKTYHDETNVYVSIQDTGCGIAPKDIYRIFDYGFTTKQPGSGSGIGLALSKNIVTKHSGEIIVHTVEGKGTEMIVKIPLIQNSGVVEAFKR